MSLGDTRGAVINSGLTEPGIGFPLDYNVETRTVTNAMDGEFWRVCRQRCWGGRWEGGGGTDDPSRGLNTYYEWSRTITHHDAFEGDGVTPASPCTQCPDQSVKFPRHCFVNGDGTGDLIIDVNTGQMPQRCAGYAKSTKYDHYTKNGLYFCQPGNGGPGCSAEHLQQSPQLDRGSRTTTRGRRRTLPR